jgi:wobble nucleotide-excising tRNase
MNKVNNPSDKIVLDHSNDIIIEINKIIEIINNESLSFNKKLEQKKQVEDNINNDFWKIIYSRCEQTIDLFNLSMVKLDNKLKVLRNEYQLELEKKKVFNQEILQLQNKASSTESSIIKINNQLKSLGIMSFYIESLKEQVGLYKISRDKQVATEEKVYKTLSEGEKTLITFLYFVETCFGSNLNNSPTILSNRIIVIDDPISSLSHNYVFDVASMIHHRIIENEFKQILILTHNLYFFHELLLLKNPNPNNRINEYNLFRVFKSDHSNIEPMERHSLQNDYQTYWQVVKDCREGKAQSNMLPNAMRNILEHYFNFIHKQSNLKQALDKISVNENEFKPFLRYINRKSHSDSINLFDTGAVTTEKYLEKFKEIFIETGFEEHYISMLGD